MKKQKNLQKGKKISDKSYLPDSLSFSDSADWSIDLNHTITDSDNVRSLFNSAPDFPGSHTQLYSPSDRWRLNQAIRECLTWVSPEQTRINENIRQTSDGKTDDKTGQQANDRKANGRKANGRKGQTWQTSGEQNTAAQPLTGLHRQNSAHPRSRSFKSLIIPVATERSPVKLVEEYISPRFGDNGEVTGCVCKVVNITNKLEVAPDDRFSSSSITAVGAGQIVDRSATENLRHQIKHHSFIPNWCATVAHNDESTSSQPTQSITTREKAQLLDDLAEGISATDQNGNQFFANDAFHSFKRTTDQMPAENLQELDTRLAILEADASRSGATQIDEFEVVTATSVNRYLVSKTPFNSRGGCTTAVKRITGLPANRDHRRLYSCDPLTGLLDRPGVLKALNPLFKSVRTDDQPGFTIICIRLETAQPEIRSTAIPVYSQLMCMAAATVDTRIRPQDICGRWSDDEIIIGIPRISLNNAAIVAARIEQSLKSIRFMHNNRPVETSIHIGLAIKNSNSITLNELIAESQSSHHSSQRHSSNQRESSVFAEIEQSTDIELWPTGISISKSIN